MKPIFAACTVIALISSGPVLADRAATQALNALRAARGLAPVVYSPKLEQAAARHANDMARRGFFSHRGSDGSRFTQRIKRSGYQACYSAENIAQGTGSTGGTIKAWENSPPHLKNMANRKAQAFGIARANGDYWVMVLAAPC